MVCLLFCIATMVVALLTGLYPRPLTARDREAGARIGRAIRNAMVIQVGETMAGQGGWKFGPPPPPATLEPAGAKVMVLHGTR